VNLNGNALGADFCVSRAAHEIHDGEDEHRTDDKSDDAVQENRAQHARISRSQSRHRTLSSADSAPMASMTVALRSNNREVLPLTLGRKDLSHWEVCLVLPRALPSTKRRHCQSSKQRVNH
jgi:hypothetical protein